MVTFRARHVFLCVTSHCVARFYCCCKAISTHRNMRSTRNIVCVIIHSEGRFKVLPIYLPSVVSNRCIYFQKKARGNIKPFWFPCIKLRDAWNDKTCLWWRKIQQVCWKDTKSKSSKTRKHTFLQYDGDSNYQWLVECIDKWDPYSESL